MPSGDELFTTQLDLIDRVIRFTCRRHHLSAADAEDFASHARLRLIENGYAILARFEGRSNLRTFLAITIQRIFLDYRNAMWGKWRPSAEATRLGPIGMLLEQLIVRDGHSLDEACEIVTTNHRIAIARPELERIAGRIPVRHKRRFEGDEALVNVPADLASADRPDRAERAEEARLVSAALQQELAALPAQDRLIVRARFEDGRTIAEIAAMLRLEVKPLYRRVERVLRDLRAALERRGISAAEAAGLLEMGNDSLTAAGEAETPAGRPSIARGADA